MSPIKLTNFTESKEIYSYLDRQFTNEFNEIINSKSIAINKNKRLVELILTIFKDYPSFRSYFTGYTNKEKETITFFLGTIVIIDKNQIKSKILNEINTYGFESFFLEEFENNISIPDDTYIGDDTWMNDKNDDIREIEGFTVTLIDTDFTEQTVEFSVGNEITNIDGNGEYSFYFLQDTLNHIYDENGNDSNIDELYPDLVLQMQAWCREILNLPEPIIDNRKEITISKYPQKVSLPSNILEWLKRDGGIISEAKQVARWYNKYSGRNISGGTTIGKSPQTLVLDIQYQSGDIYIDYKGNIDVCGVENIINYKQFVNAIETRYKLITE